jgi:cytoskeletal protein CcmA (bactofilin family)
MWDNTHLETNGTTPRPAPQASAVIGRSISVKGEISGSEDLLVEGRAEGTINLPDNVVTISESGQVNAHIYGRLIHVEGEVTGDLFGSEQIVIHRTGRVRGNISAPRIALEDGAKLKGMIDTETHSASTQETPDRTQAEAARNDSATEELHTDASDDTETSESALPPKEEDTDVDQNVEDEEDDEFTSYQ